MRSRRAIWLAALLGFFQFARQNTLTVGGDRRESLLNLVVKNRARGYVCDADQHSISEGDEDAYKQGQLPDNRRPQERE